MKFLELKVSGGSEQFDLPSLIAEINLVPCSLKVDVKGGKIRIYKAEEAALKKLLDLISMHYFIESAFVNNLGTATDEENCAFLDEDVKAPETADTAEASEASESEEDLKPAEEESTSLSEDVKESEASDVKEVSEASESAEDSKPAEEETIPDSKVKEANLEAESEKSVSSNVVGSPKTECAGLTTKKLETTQVASSTAKANQLPKTPKSKAEEKAEEYCKKNQEDFESALNFLDMLEARYREEHPEEYPDEDVNAPKEEVSGSKASDTSEPAKKEDSEDCKEGNDSKAKLVKDDSSKILTTNSQEEFLSRFVGKSIMQARKIKNMDKKIEFFLLDIGMKQNDCLMVTEVFNLYMASKEKKFSLEYLCSQTKRVKRTGRGKAAVKNGVLASFKNWAIENCPELLKKFPKASISNLFSLFANNV